MEGLTIQSLWLSSLKIRNTAINLKCFKEFNDNMLHQLTIAC